MKKKYQRPLVSKVDLDVESAFMDQSYNYADTKKSGRTFEDDEDITPAAPKKFWDDEE